MHEHLGLNDEQGAELLGSGVTVKNMFDFARNYAVKGSDNPLTYVNLFYYVDEKGDFDGAPHFAHKKIARVLFENLDIKQKIELSEYISDLEDGEF